MVIIDEVETRYRIIYYDTWSYPQSVSESYDMALRL